MSIRGKEVRPEIDHVSHERLSTLALFKESNINAHAARLLEKAIAGEWHEYSLLIKRAERFGKRRKPAEDGG